MKKILAGILTLGSFSAFAIDYSVECYAKVKCPNSRQCAFTELVVDVVENEVQSVTAKSSRRSNEVVSFRTSREGMVKISGEDAFGDSFSAKIDLTKVSETEEYSIAGKYNILRIHSVELACRKI